MRLGVSVDAVKLSLTTGMDISLVTRRMIDPLPGGPATNAERLARVSRIAKIDDLSAEELRGWVSAVTVFAVRDWFPGERDALVRRAAVLGLSASEVGL